MNWWTFGIAVALWAAMYGLGYWHGWNRCLARGWQSARAESCGCKTLCRREKCPEHEAIKGR